MLAGENREQQEIVTLASPIEAGSYIAALKQKIATGMKVTYNTSDMVALMQ